MPEEGAEVYGAAVVTSAKAPQASADPADDMYGAVDMPSPAIPSPFRGASTALDSGGDGDIYGNAEVAAAVQSAAIPTAAAVRKKAALPAPSDATQDEIYGNADVLAPAAAPIAPPPQDKPALPTPGAAPGEDIYGNAEVVAAHHQPALPSRTARPPLAKVDGFDAVASDVMYGNLDAPTGEAKRGIYPTASADDIYESTDDALAGASAADEVFG